MGTLMALPQSNATLVAILDSTAATVDEDTAPTGPAGAELWAGAVRVYHRIREDRTTGADGVDYSLRQTLIMENTAVPFTPDADQQLVIRRDGETTDRTLVARTVQVAAAAGVPAHVQTTRIGVEDT